MRLQEKDFRAAVDRLIANAKEQPSKQEIIEVQRIIARLGDAHTRTNYEAFLDQSTRMPFHGYWFEEWYFHNEYSCGL